MARRILAGVFFIAGAAWTIGFPKKASLEWDTVFSVAISLALFGTGTLTLLADRIGRGRAVVSILLLLSLLANACLLSQNAAMADVLRQHTRSIARGG
jgi:hypothetical protein